MLVQAMLSNSSVDVEKCEILFFWAVFPDRYINMLRIVALVTENSSRFLNPKGVPPTKL